MMMSDIWSVNGISSQKPRPHASTTCSVVAGVAASAAAMTSTVARSAKMKASGTQRSAQSVSASAARATGPGCSVMGDARYLTESELLARKQAESVRLSIVDANDRAARLELEASSQRERAAKAELALLELQKRLAWRSIDDSQERTIATALS